MWDQRWSLLVGRRLVAKMGSEPAFPRVRTARTCGFEHRVIGDSENSRPLQPITDIASGPWADAVDRACSCSIGVEEHLSGQRLGTAPVKWDSAYAVLASAPMLLDTSVSRVTFV